MVKSYDRYEQERVFGVINTQSNILWLPSTEGQSSKSAGRVLAAAVEEILVWDVRTGDILQRLSDGVTPGASNAPSGTPPSAVSYLAYNKVNNIVASGYNDGTIKVWDLASGDVIIKFQGHKSRITRLKFDHNGTRLVSGSADCSIILWDLVSEEGLFKLKGHKSEITDLAFLAKTVKHDDEMDDYIVTVSKDGLIKLWELSSKQCIETHIAHSNECWSLGVNVSQNLLVTSGNKDQVKVWEVNLNNPDMEKLKERGMIEKQSKAKCNEIEFINIVKKGENNEVFHLKNTDRSVEMFRIRAESELQKGIRSRTKRLKDKGNTDEEILQNIKDNEVNMLITPFNTLRTTSRVRSCQWVKTSKKLNLLVSLINNTIEYYSIDVPDNIKKSEEVKLTKTHTIELLGHKTDIRTMDISRDDKLLATLSNGELKMWNLNNFNVIRNVELEGYPLCSKILPGNSVIVVGYKNGDLELWDMASSSLVDRIEEAHKGSDANNDEGSAIWSLDISPDGQKLITGGNDKAVKIWSFKVEQEIVPGTKEVVNKLRFKHEQTIEMTDEILAVRVSPNGKLLAVSLLNNNVQILYLDSFKLFLTLYGHKLPVLSIDISSDSKLIITSSADKNIKIWGLDFGDCHKSIFGHQDSIMNVRFIGETHNFFSSGKDGLIKYWDGDKFECVQRLAAHQAEVWSMCVSSNGLFMVSASHDHSIRLWAATSDQVFLEEEREKEMDELYENTLIDSLEEPTADLDKDKEEEETDEVTRVTKQTIESLKAGEKLIEAIDIGHEDLVNRETYEREMKRFERGEVKSKPTRTDVNPILKVFELRGEDHVLKTISSIKRSQLEDALLVLPFSYTVKLLRFIEIWAQRQTSLILVIQVLNLLIKNNFKELVNQKDSHLKGMLEVIGKELKRELTTNYGTINYNIEGLKFVRSQWKLHHEQQFVDEHEQQEHDDKRAVKRKVLTI